MPKVSVCIPTYNSARYLPEAIESVLQQDFEDYELLIADNASTDRTPEVCRKYSDPRIRYLRFDQMLNQPGNWNRIIELANGDFISILHADDRFLPGFLADRVRRLTVGDRLQFVFGAAELINDKGKIISNKQVWLEDCIFESAELIEIFLQGCHVCPPTLMVRKSCVQRAGHFRTDITWCHDWEWTLRLAQQGRAQYCSTPFAQYRVHDLSGTEEILRGARNGQQERQMLDEFIKDLGLPMNRTRRLRRHAFHALGRRLMYYAEHSLLKNRRVASLRNLRYATLADTKLLLRPTFWAMLLGAIGSPQAYKLYKRARALSQIRTNNDNANAS